MNKKICMIGPDPSVMGGIAAVVSGYLQSELSHTYNIKYISSHKDGSKFKKLIIAIKAYLNFIIYCILSRPDIIHIHSSFGPSFYRKAIFIYIGNLFNIPIINHIHGAEFDRFYEQASSRKKSYIKKVYSRCDVIVVLSKEWKEKIEKITSNNEIVIVENYAEVPKVKPGLEGKKDYVLFLGEVGKRKGAYDIPDVVEKVVKTIKNVKFIICGNGEIEDIKKILNEKGLNEYVEFRGWIGKEEKIKLLSCSKVYFLPSYNEGLPMSILEAMAYGLPVVSTDVGGIPTVVQNGINGFIYKPGSNNEFADAIIKILSDVQLYEKLSVNNYDKVRNFYSLETNINKLNRIYLSLLLRA